MKKLKEGGKENNEKSLNIVIKHVFICSDPYMLDDEMQSLITIIIIFKQTTIQ